MRLLVLLPDLVTPSRPSPLIRLVQRHPRLAWLRPLRQRIVHPHLYTSVAWGGTLNNMRHAAVARSLGIDARIACPSGRDTYGPFNVVNVPYVSWQDRRDDDVVLLPDFCSELADEVRGPTIVYLQSPIQLRRDFDFLSDRVRLWANSPFMLEHAVAMFPGKSIGLAPIIVDAAMFPFIPQAHRETGLLFAFPRKGPEFITATQEHYARLGGTYWRFELIDGLPLHELARQMRRPQAFLASSEIEGCALPPQESMAAGIVVVGRSARGANFQMRHRETAMVGETPEEAAICLRELEDDTRRDIIARNAVALIRRYFPEEEPTAYWRSALTDLGFSILADEDRERSLEGPSA